MPYSCVSMLPVMLAIILLALEHTSEGIEYHVKPTDPEVTQCPGQPCHTLAEYLVNNTWDYTANANVVIMPGHHRVTRSFLVRFAFNLTLVGSTSVNHTLQDTRPILHIASIVFYDIMYLNLTGVIVIKSYELEKFPFFALTFTGIFSLQFRQIAVYSTRSGIAIRIEHSSFSYGSHIFIDCPSNAELSDCEVSRELHVHLNNKISIQDCIFKFSDEGESSLIERLGSGSGIYIMVNYTDQKIQISNCTLVGNGIAIGVGSRFRNNQSAVTYAATEIEIIRTIIRDLIPDFRGWGLKLIFRGIDYSQPSIILKNVLFSSNSAHRLSAVLPSIVYMEYAQNVSFVDCNFTDNRGTAIVAHSSRFNVSGTLIFVNNTGYEGGALAFYDKSSMHIHNNTKILFAGNYAQRVGGAIFVKNCWKFKSKRLCFFQLPDVITYRNIMENLRLLDISFTFVHNKAKDGGDAIYGGMLYRCAPTQHTIYSGAFVLTQNRLNITTYKQTGFSKITSDPMRVCLCMDGKPDCFTNFATKTHYPGETFTVSAVVVGQELGTVNGTVYAQFLPLSHSETEPSLRDLQESQRVGHDSCTELKYSILSVLYNLEILVLTAQDISMTEYLDPSRANHSANHYQKRTQKGFVLGNWRVSDFKQLPQDFTQLPVYLNVTLLPCPLGFMLSGPPGECVCHTTLQYHKISCTIDNQRVRRSGTFWLNASFNGNTSDGAIVHKHCPFGYCNPAELDVDLRYPDSQCAFNHSGTLCGACQPGLSLVLGTSQCLSCSNSHLSLLLLFAVMGLILVCLIKALNLTVSEGAINGLIFYANIVGANQTIFFPPGDTNVLMVFIAWLNLDFGFQSCFFKGFNSYWKTWLQFVFPAYVWIVVALIIVLSHYISLVARIFGSNSVPILATLFLLSYSKLLRTIIASLSFTYLEYPNGSRIALWTNDGNIVYFSPEHAPLFLVAMAVLLLLWVPYTTLLLFVQCLQKKTNLRWVTKLKPFFDAYFGPFKDRHRYWVGAMLLVRVLLLLTFAANPTSAPRVNLLAIATTSLVILMYTSLGKVYKKWYLTLLENSFVLNLGMLAVGTLFINQGGGSQAALVYTSVGVAFSQFVVIATVYAYTSLKELRSLKVLREKFITRRQDNEPEDIAYELLEANRQPRSLVMNFDELREPVLEYAD